MRVRGRPGNFPYKPLIRLDFSNVTLSRYGGRKNTILQPEGQSRDIKLRAKREKKREAEVIRELLSEGLHESRSASGERQKVK